ncbi:hypothetical protein K488DRAFT_54010 [Vararia minispora EC-137]|uniref:Uncharacterized protein n=1 Tax=Vararia minispora EC-137 TaxID=1314806 RepID=A0ACB8QFT4_9AGAM|nr:hypothetical protein K488DRAFT_54010 [Vararia minispora EC-137]
MSGLVPPPYTLTQANLLNAAFTLGYVGPLYMSQYTRPSSSITRFRDGWRNDPSVIKVRLLFVSISTVLSCVAIHWVVSQEGKRDDGDFTVPLNYIISSRPQARLSMTVQYMGLTMNSQHLLACLVTPSLFLGPIYAHFLRGDLPFMSNWKLETHVYDKISTWQGIRNFVFGPVTEELVWRSCVIAAYHLARASRNQMIFLTPLSFGAGNANTNPIAHLHHGFETFTRLGRNANAFKIALISTLFQFAYTTLFGFHCAFLFIRSGTVFVPMIAHVFCNIMGVPQLQQEVRQHPGRASQIKIMYVLGIISYIYTMRHWTLNPESIFWMSVTRPATAY